MHEMGIALQIIEIAEASIPAELRNPRVEKINLKVGKLTAIVPESLHFCFEVAARETRLAGAVLNIEEIPILARCNDCNFEWTVEAPVFTCRRCDSRAIELLSGRELDIDSIEVIDADDDNPTSH